MSLVKDAIQSLIQEGDITHEVTIGKTKFVMSLLSNEEQLLADGLVDTTTIREKYKADASFAVTYRDAVDKMRGVAMVAFAIKKVNGKPPVDEAASLADQYKQRVEFRDELLGLNTPTQDKLIREYNQLVIKQGEFLDNIEENTGK